MTWKSREDLSPPPQFYADVLGYLRLAFPGAELSREALTALVPHLVREWRNGQSARNAAKATCACDGRRVTVSPAAEVLLARRAALPPQGATRGSIFGIDELRERREVGALRVKAAVEERHAEHQAARITQLEAERAARLGAGKEARAARLIPKLAAAEAARRRHLSQAAHLRQEAERIAKERGFWTPPTAQEAAQREAERKPVSKTQPPKPAVPKAPRAKPAPKPAPLEPAQTPPKRRKAACDLCTEAAPPDAELGALVDAFVEAARKDEGK